MCVSNMKAPHYNAKSTFSYLGPMKSYQMVAHGLNMSLSGNPSNENIRSAEIDKQQYSGERVDRPTPKSRIYSKWIR